MPTVSDLIQRTAQKPRKSGEAAVLCAPEPLSPRSLGMLLGKKAKKNTPVILCIGTDRIIGDCLGPLVGTQLVRESRGKLPVFGTLSDTVHALNLPDAARKIQKEYPGRTVIAVDASLGAQEQVGSVFVRPGGLRPGAGVRKDLPSAGDISVTGIVGVSGTLPYFDLQTVRLAAVAAMAEAICQCILSVCL